MIKVIGLIPSLTVYRRGTKRKEKRSIKKGHNVGLVLMEI